MAIRQFTTTARQDAAITSLAAAQGMTEQEFIDAFVIDKFLAELVERERVKNLETVKGKYERATDEQRGQVDDILRNVNR